ncbi:MAG: hypothetical protein KAH24_01875 [Holophagae bacterium]|nr:hypothetical protein [Holophagae bacterium]
MNRKSGFMLFLAIVMLLFTPRVTSAEPAQGLTPLKPLSGKWVGKGEGTNGPSVVKQVYAFMLDGTHFQSRSTARFKPQNDEKTGRIQKAAGIFSFDPTEKVIRCREFTSDGRVQCYKLVEVSKDGMTLTFQTDTENGSNMKQQTRLAFHVTNRNNLQTTVSQAADGKTFKQVETIVLRRVKLKKAHRARQKLKKEAFSADLN